jgi:hypothetical protein
VSETENAGRPLASEEELQASARKVVHLPSGMGVEIRRVGVAKLAQIMRANPDVSALARAAGKVEKDLVAQPAAETLAAGEALGRMMEEVILAGVRKPKLGRDPEQGPVPSDFTEEDQGVLFKEILELSRYTREAGEEVLPLSRSAG